MAASRTRTASTCTPKTARGTHVFKIAGYSLHSALGADASITSATFNIGGHDWFINVYPAGTSSSEEDAGHIAAFLYRVATNKKQQQQLVRASFDFRLVDQKTGQSMVLAKFLPRMISTLHGWGTRRLMNKTKLQASTYLQDDCLVIECDVTVISNGPHVEETAISPRFEVRVPPPNLSDNLGELLGEKKGVDVVFKVRDEVFTAHKIVLALRSPVFDAEFYGPASEERTCRQCITIQDVHPSAFRALLHFIYKDSMIAMEGFYADERMEIIKNLLAVADRWLR
nr:unnamed protein product [Digitaria exilis]